jgi:hypothetical protein
VLAPEPRDRSGPFSRVTRVHVCNCATLPNPTKNYGTPQVSPDSLSNDVVELRHELAVLRVEHDRLLNLRARTRSTERANVDILLRVIDRDIRMRETKIEILTKAKRG